MVKDRLIWLKKNIFLASLMVLVGGSAMAQLVNLAFQPVITRLYTPADFGIYGLFLSSVSIMLIITTLGYDQSVNASPDENEAQQLMFGTIYLSAIVSTVLFVIILIFDPQIMGLFKVNGVHWWYFVPINIFVTIIYSVTSLFNYRLQKHKDLAASAIWRAVSLNAFQIALYYCGLGYLGLVIGNTIGLFFGISKLARNILDGDIDRDNAKWSHIRGALAKNQQYPLYLLPASFVERFKREAITYIIFYLYSPAQVGIYLLTHRVLMLPTSMISDSIRQLFIVQLAKPDYDPVTVRKFYLRLTVLMLIGISVPFLILYFYGGSIFTLVFGKQWGEAGSYIRAMCLVYIANFVVYPLSGTALVLKKQKGILFFQIALSAAVLLAAAAAKFGQMGIVQYLSMQAMVMASIYAAMWLYCYRMIK